MRCGRCGDEIAKRAPSVVITEGNFRFTVHTFCPRSSVEVVRTRENNLEREDRKHRIKVA